ncbi:DUF1399 domain-containing protein [Epilithonimonas zeae]|uniref:DUF1399 domain-containing protein n=1 Tax=Epilithonimonas zeae TaxID=1416779 RepID=UPI00200E7C4C|nr:DUF1399 domain-containing protein [Epilithonimonas zeae]UQB68806.1 DUF1399 domain-containing protein [Epilithonimonas zeae]
MNKELWDEILQFDFDDPPSEYGFTTRLANENFWTEAFTELAILEYKKFMYLAATSEMMVSPSEIVDTVWHQHLIFTQSYQNFCTLIGKQIQHIPSTHNRAEFEKFSQAKERTQKLYSDVFGEQPKSIWDYPGMFDSLNLEKARFKIRTFLVFGILGFIALVVPFYFFLKPIYIEINNPYFVIGFISLSILTFAGLEFYNRIKLKNITKGFDKNSFIYRLEPYELVYLKTQRLDNIINGTVNELIDRNIIFINPDKTIDLLKSKKLNSQKELQVIATLEESGRTHYTALLRQLMNKPIFSNTAKWADAFQKYIIKSKKFGNLFYTNFVILNSLLLLGFIRLITGILREKPVFQILMITVILIVLIIYYLNRLTKLFSTKTIPDLYKTEILPTRQIQDAWQWQYFLTGAAVLTATFIPVISYTEKNNYFGNDSGSSSSCGSSCGSSCSSCGGCGGGD